MIAIRNFTTHVTKLLTNYYYCILFLVRKRTRIHPKGKGGEREGVVWERKIDLSKLINNYKYANNRTST